MVSGSLSQLTLDENFDSLSRAAMVNASREGFAKWLADVFGQVPQVGLGTYTFRDPDTRSDRPIVSIGRQFVTRAAVQLVSMLMEGGSTCFVCVEVGSDTRRLHLHSLESNESRMRKQIHLWWKKKYGHEKYSVVESRKGVSLYVTKYVTKSDMPFWAGGPLYSTFREPIDLAVDQPM